MNPKTRELMWTGQYWGSEGALKLRRRELLPDLDNPRKRLTALVSLASLYYSAASNASKRKRWFSFIWWIFPIAWCLWKAWRYAEKARRKWGFIGMNADQLDVYQSIARRAAKLLFWKKKRTLCMAQRAIEHALEKVDSDSHSQALLLCGKADLALYAGERRVAYQAATEAKGIAEALFKTSLEDKQMLRQVARVFRHCTAVFQYLGAGHDFDRHWCAHLHQQVQNALDVLAE